MFKKMKDLVGNGSARDWFEQGEIYDNGKYFTVLLKKIVMAVNKCPFCKSKNTYHAKVPKYNVWREETTYLNGYGKLFKKWDFCFKCQREFLIEAYLYFTISKKECKKLYKKYKNDRL